MAEQTAQSTQHPRLSAAALFLDGAAVVYLIAYAWPILDPAIRTEPLGHACGITMAVVWALFAVDFIVRFARAEHRLQFVRHNLIDLAAVALPMLRPLRLLQVLMLVGAIGRRTGRSIRTRVAVDVVAAAVLVLVVGSLAVLDAERDAPGANIHTFGTALWWGITTVTTVGYGDVYPVTVAGRMVATVLMLTGIALLGVITASVASWITDKVREVEQATASSHEEMQALRHEVGRLRDSLTKPTPADD